MSQRRSADIASPEDAISLLTNDHQEVAGLFERYQTLADEGADDVERQSLAEEICTMLLVHAMIEEEIFYPAARDALDEDDLVNDAYIEHQSAKDLIAQIQSGDPTDPMYDACVRVLGEYVQHHVREEEDNLFPQLRETDLDLDELGVQLSERQEDLLTAASEVDMSRD